MMRFYCMMWANSRPFRRAAACTLVYCSANTHVTLMGLSGWRTTHIFRNP